MEGPGAELAGLALLCGARSLTRHKASVERLAYDAEPWPFTWREAPVEGITFDVGLWPFVWRGALMESRGGGLLFGAEPWISM